MATVERPPRSYEGVPNLPIMIHLRGVSWSRRPGGIEFVDCVVEDDQDRPFMAYRAVFDDSPALYDVNGNIVAKNPHGARTDMGQKLVKVDLRIND